MDHWARTIITTLLSSANGIWSVLGLGAGYLRERTVAVIVVFSREHVPNEIAERLTPLGSILKTATTGLVDQGRFFRNFESPLMTQ